MPIVEERHPSKEDETDPELSEGGYPTPRIQLSVRPSVRPSEYIIIPEVNAQGCYRGSTHRGATGVAPQCFL